MKNKDKYAISLHVVDVLYNKGSWCGETHVQKNIYVLETLASVPLDLNFILYKHGPYSFDLHDIISDMRGLGFIETEQRPPYGPRLRLTSEGSAFLEKNYHGEYDDKIEKVTSLLQDKTVQGLEKFATALMIFVENSNNSIEERANYLHSIKPHISYEDALEATKRFDEVQPSFH